MEAVWGIKMTVLEDFIFTQLSIELLSDPSQRNRKWSASLLTYDLTGSLGLTLNFL